jgi:hypothetical protein
MKGNRIKCSFTQLELLVIHNALGFNLSVILEDLEDLEPSHPDFRAVISNVGLIKMLIDKLELRHSHLRSVEAEIYRPEDFCELVEISPHL